MPSLASIKLKLNSSLSTLLSRRSLWRRYLRLRRYRRTTFIQLIGWALSNYPCFCWASFFVTEGFLLKGCISVLVGSKDVWNAWGSLILSHRADFSKRGSATAFRGSGVHGDSSTSSCSTSSSYSACFWDRVFTCGFSYSGLLALSHLAVKLISLVRQLMIYRHTRV